MEAWRVTQAVFCSAKIMFSSYSPWVNGYLFAFQAVQVPLYTSYALYSPKAIIV